jgi:predicted site-specific integrase-resolvase
MNTLNQKKQQNYSGSQSIPSSTGIKKEKLNVSEPKETTEDFLCQKSINLQPLKQPKKSAQKKKEEYATAVSQPEGKKKTLKDRLSSSDVNTLTMKLCMILDRESTSLVDEGIKGNIKEIVVTHRDRLCRFGFDLIEHIISTSNGKIVVLNQQQTSPQEELVDDLISIITVFSSRLYGLRSHTIKKQIKDQALKNSKDKIVSNGGRKETTKTDDGTI